MNTYDDDDNVSAGLVGKKRRKKNTEIQEAKMTNQRARQS